MKERNDLLPGVDNTTLGLPGRYYQCPMRCEGDKKYDEPGNCPVCNMKLVLVDDKTHGYEHH